MTSMPHWLSKQSFLQPERHAVEFMDGSFLTFRDLETRSKRMAGALAHEGIKEKDHVAVLSVNHPSFIEVVFGLSYLGARAVLLNIRLTPEELSYQVKDAEVETFIYGPEQAEKVAGLGNENLTFLSFRDLEGEYQTPELKETIELDEVFTLMYTSGTTGNPKAVLHTYGNHWFSAVSSALNLGFDREDKWLLNLPLFHVSGFSTLMKSVVYGMTIEFHDHFDAKAVVESIRQRGITMVSGVSVMLGKLVKALEGKELPSSFRCFLLGGGPATETLLKQANEAGIPVFQTYGMTETTSQIVTLSPQDAVRKLGSAGKALATASVHIDADEGETGEIMVEGPMVSEGYYNRERPTTRFFATGDMGRFDEEGFLYVVGRKKEMIISGGENVYPAEIENVLVQVDGVQEAAVVGVDDEKWGEVPAAFVTGEGIDRQHVKNACLRLLARFKHPAYIYHITELPRNASNKVMKHLLIERMKEGKYDEIE
ncbi:o-succinylbenzoate--CoA ligase [Salimicrobium flavidum]|uniref:2-succinylbenzoate--CoA ligase n=1 Tax=Salimicrobium flavidum TaxID=570947 RepID=A0A1N7J464_9BACI|nr:o-succinylbenzoate--CoA ligase [Salimicrobium flavidum]SIS44036.1 2-succinylbenzoyl-CoA synthetase [Salimicrobium flavidum]